MLKLNDHAVVYADSVPLAIPLIYLENIFY